MAKKSQKRSKENLDKPEALNQPWLSRQAGLQIMGFVSLGLAVFVGWQIYPAGGWVQAVLWGVGAGLSIWGIFFLMYLFNTRVTR